MGKGRGMDSTGTGQDRMVGSYEQYKEPLSSIIGAKYVDQLIDCKFLTTLLLKVAYLVRSLAGSLVGLRNNFVSYIWQSGWSHMLCGEIVTGLGVRMDVNVLPLLCSHTVLMWE
jgi:hypothetical protein